MEEGEACEEAYIGCGQIRVVDAMIIAPNRRDTARAVTSSAFLRCPVYLSRPSPAPTVQQLPASLPDTASKCKNTRVSCYVANSRLIRQIKTSAQCYSGIYARPPSFKISSSLSSALFRRPILCFENSPLKSSRSKSLSICRRTSSSPSSRFPRFGRKNEWNPDVLTVLMLYSIDLDASVAEKGCCVVD